MDSDEKFPTLSDAAAEIIEGNLRMPFSRAKSSLPLRPEFRTVRQQMEGQAEEAICMPAPLGALQTGEG